MERRLAAILAADVAGSSGLIEADESYALAAIHAALSDVLIVAASRHGGRLIKTMGDRALLEFASPVEAVVCADEVQSALIEAAQSLPEDRQVLLRIGINLGDVVIQRDGDVYGDGVNVAARLEGLSEPGGIAVSGKVYAELQGKVSLPFHDCGDRALKNIARPVRVWTMGRAKPAASPSDPKGMPRLFKERTSRSAY